MQAHKNTRARIHTGRHTNTYIDTQTDTHASPLVSGIARNPKRAIAKENAANATIPESEVRVCCGEIKIGEEGDEERRGKSDKE